MSKENLSILTEDPILCDNYVLFGVWPQSLKSADVKIDESKTYKINEWDCYKGSDGAFYVKATAKPFKIKAEAVFNNGETVKENKAYYFKMESIKWRILDNNYGGGKLLLSEKALCGCCFDTHFFWDDKDPNSNPEEGGIERTINGKTVYGNNYEFSTIRAYLNGLNGSFYDVDDFSNKGFISKAFSQKAITRINTVTVDNSAASTTDSGNNIETVDDYVCNNTKDKIFLLSEREATNKSFGFDSYNKGISSENATLSRYIKYTDYSLATGVYTETTENYKNSCCWWLRSPAYDISISARNVDFDGTVDEYTINCISNDDLGVVPALSISF